MTSIRPFKFLRLVGLKLQLGAAAIMTTTLLAAAPALATSVVYVGNKYVIIDAGKLHGLSRDDEVCVGLAEQPPVACGPVRALKNKLSGVRIKTALTPLITVGMAATSPTIRTDVDIKPATKKEIAKLVDALNGKKSQPAEPSPEGDASEPTSTSSSNHWRVALAYIFTPRLPYSYSTPNYALSSEVNGTGSLWQSGTPINSSPLGVDLQLGWELDQTSAITFGITNHMLANDVAIAAYDLLKPDANANSKTTATDLGAWLGMQFNHPLMEHLTLISQGDIGAEQVVVKTSVTASSDGNQTAITSATARMTMFGARIGVNLQWLATAPLALTVGTRFTLPLAGQASVSSGDTTLRSTVSATQNASSSEDLASALGLRKSGIGIEAMLGMALIFP
ncbi:MAG: hypothetical protein NTY08_00970 [Proteobacteria bacterium]|nr:hypothetical protein [Pseudomonadota bacterium]